MVTAAAQRGDCKHFVLLVQEREMPGRAWVFPEGSVWATGVAVVKKLCCKAKNTWYMKSCTGTCRQQQIQGSLSAGHYIWLDWIHPGTRIRWSTVIIADYSHQILKAKDCLFVFHVGLNFIRLLVLSSIHWVPPPKKCGQHTQEPGFVIITGA